MLVFFEFNMICKTSIWCRNLANVKTIGNAVFRVSLNARKWVRGRLMSKLPVLQYV